MILLQMDWIKGRKSLKTTKYPPIPPLKLKHVVLESRTEEEGILQMPKLPQGSKSWVRQIEFPRWQKPEKVAHTKRH